MRQRIGRLFVLAFVLLVPALSDAATRTLDCSTGTINAFLPRLRSGDTLVVSGTCGENVVIGAGRNNITLDGQGTATINGIDAASNTIIIRGNNVTIRAFIITGGSRGILVNRGGQATIDGNEIHSTGSDGVQVSDGSSARITNNFIHDNPGDGVNVSGASSANIGILTGSDVTASPNTIQTSGGKGINVVRSSSARVVGNAINGNAGDGIGIGDNSHGDIASNAINSNAAHGIFLLRGGDVRLGRNSGTGIFDLSNSTTSNNTLRGIACLFGGSADGRLGTLNGTDGAKLFTGTTCVDSLDP